MRSNAGPNSTNRRARAKPERSVRDCNGRYVAQIDCLHPANSLIGSIWLIPGTRKEIFVLNEVTPQIGGANLAADLWQVATRLKTTK